MSDGVYIPGLSSKYGSSESIKKIMDSKREKLDKLENEKEILKDEKKIWSELKSKAQSFQNSAKKMYGFEAPFDDKLSVSSDEASFSANVSRNAEIGEYRINIKKKAASHKIAGAQLERNYKIQSGEYLFKIGDENFKVNFSGGSLDDFAQKIKKDSGEKIKTIVANDTSKTQVFILESSIFGDGNFITFENDLTRNVFKAMGFYEETNTFDKRIAIEDKTLVNLSENKRNSIIDENGSLVLKTNDKYRINLPENVPYKEGLVMTIDLKTLSLDEVESSEKIDPTGPNFSQEGSVNIYDIEIEGESSLVDIPTYEKIEEPVKETIIDDKYVSLITNKRTINLEELDVNSEDKTLSFDMKDIIAPDEAISSVLINNNNTEKVLFAKNLRFYDKEALTGVKFRNELSSPSNASLTLDGLKIDRESNVINDLIKGVTLNIFDKTDREETLKIDRDYNKIAESVNDFIGEYNQILDFINNETNVDAMEYREEDKEKTGKLSKDYTLRSLVTKLRVIMMNPYPTDFGAELSNLSQIGISTNESNKGFDATKMKGILEVNPDKFIEQMEKYPAGIKQLFGSDTDGDILIDNGIAYEAERLLKAYTTRDVGYFDSKTNSIDNRIENQNKSIDSYKEVLDKEEKDLKEKFFKMEKAAQELEENKKRFDNLDNK
ncbi:MAG: flagellar filament capping protein FliD [Spirochaetes bacterium]|nr:flagellar filament capping protein FliD [Spirochaetota bacterium]